METEIKIGSVVQLKCGGPLMVVIKPNVSRVWAEEYQGILNAHYGLERSPQLKDDDTVYCQCYWFDNDNTMQSGEFPLEAMHLWAGRQEP
jgi:uncharacterized protein YodC (DUF2158 family)